MKFRKKPIIVEAEQLTDKLALECLINRTPGPMGLSVCGNCNPADRKLFSAYVIIETLEGRMRAELWDWIIRGVKGELYPCKPEIFAATYEPIEIVSD